VNAGPELIKASLETEVLSVLDLSPTIDLGAVYDYI
jgi:hypothetical protein